MRRQAVCNYADVINPEEWDKYFAPAFEINGRAMDVTIQKVPVLGRRVRINVASRSGFSTDEVKRHQSAMDLLEIIINSLEFKKKVLDKKFTTTNKTPQQIYDRIIAGNEDLQPGVDSEIDITVTMYEANNRVVGYTYPDTVRTWVNRKFFKMYELGEIACNAFHEWLHKLGFGHASASDHSSVPYALGYLVEDMIRSYEKGVRYVDLYPDIFKVPVEPTPANPAPGPVVIPVPVVQKKKVCKWPWYYFGLKQVCWYE